MVDEVELAPGNDCPADDCERTIKTWRSTYKDGVGECRISTENITPPGPMSEFAGDHIAIFHT